MSLNDMSIYTKEFSYKNIDGTTSTIRLRPLPVKYLPGLVSVASKLSGKSGEEIGKALDDNTVKLLVEMCIVSLQKVMPDEKQDRLEEFVACHWLSMLPVILELNISSGN